jgi:ATP-dependent Clp endopeptidase proteolytic subunit ClpP
MNNHKLGKKKAKDKKESEEPEQVGEIDEELLTEESSPIILLNSPEEEKKLRKVNIIGEVSEDKTPEILYSMWHFKENGRYLNEEEELCCEPFEVIVSTYGGSAMEMFAIYDTMRMIREECEIQTIGLGKVMSAGVLLLAAGSKGSRKIGKNCRVMIHSVIGGQHGPVHNLENELEEVKWIQEQYIDALKEETNMTKKYIKKLLERKVNVYLTAKEAVELGIADEVV